MNAQSRAIIQAQWRAIRNFYPRGGKLGFWFTILISIFWYGLWAFGALAVALLFRDLTEPQRLYQLTATGLFLATLYWQLIPILMVTSGMSLEMRRLIVYPIPHSELFSLEVLLRVTTAWEMMLMLGGVIVGLLLSPILSFWHAIALAPFIAFNLFLSTGLRDLITRLLAGRRFREIFVLLILFLATLPQILLRSGSTSTWKKSLDILPSFPSPWASTAHLITGNWSLLHVIACLGFAAAAYAFGRWQFERSLRFDEEAARSGGTQGARTSRFTEKLYRLPSRFLTDPAAALIEKELRSLIRSPRFRVLFIMGFSFGLVIWLPIAFGKGPNGFLQSHFLVIVSAYSMMLLSEVSIWNILGFDRSAAQLYWLAPVRSMTVLIAKNLTTAIFVTIEILLITTICLLFGLPVTLRMFLEAYAVCLVLLTFLAAFGNYASLRFPRPVNPNQSWRRSSASRFQAMLIFLYPVLAAPFAFAYYARYKWEAEWPFYAMLVLIASVAGTAYALSLEAAVETAAARKEQILTALGQGEGPVSS